MDARSLPWGVQWEIARLISLGYCSWNDITMDALDRIKTEGLSPPDPDFPKQTVLCARVAPRLEEFFRSERHTFGTRKVSREMMATVCYVIALGLTLTHNKLTQYAKSPWEELDKEDLAFARHGPMGCLGSIPELGDFYGGKVSFSMRTQFNEHGMFHFILEHPILGHSSRFTRCYGSSFLIRLRLSMDLSKPALLDTLKQLLIRPFILLGHVFRFFHINKDYHVYLMATNEVYSGGIILQGDQRPGTYCSFLDFFKKHNNLEENSNQVSYKLFSKSGLMLMY
jgi:RNA-dependent RNA polymerase